MEKNMHTQNRLINNNDHMISFIYKSRKHLRNIRQMPWEDPKYGNWNTTFKLLFHGEQT